MNRLYDKQLLIRTCKRIVALEDNFNLNMKSFCRQRSDDRLYYKNECATSYCIVGRLVYLDGYPSCYIDTTVLSIDDEQLRNQDFDYGEYIKDRLIIGDDAHDVDQYFCDIYKWLFDNRWPNELEHAKARAEYVISHCGMVPTVYDDFDLSLEELTTINQQG